MKKLVNLRTGELVKISFDPMDAAKKRLAQMRVAVWCGLQTFQYWQASGTDRLLMITLTYAGVDDWRPRDIRSATRWAAECGSRGTLWVAELQKRGALHYHVLMTLPVGARWTKPDGKNGAWAKGFTWVTDDIKYPWYVMKYIQKGVDDDGKRRFPKHARIYGLSRQVVNEMPYHARTVYAGLHIPAWYKGECEDETAILTARRVAGGISDRTGFKRTPYVRPYMAHVDTNANRVDNDVDLYCHFWQS